MVEPTPPGWYRDPGGTGQRYWDGQRWTEHLAPGPPAPAQAADPYRQSRQWAMFAHLSAFAALVIGLPFVGPLVIYLVKKDEDPFVGDQAREALNFNISVSIYFLVTFALTFLLILVIVGVLLLPVLFGLVVAWIVLVIVAAVRASKGEAYRYPLTIRMVS